MICLYILFIISLIIYQLRSIFWFKLVLPLKNKDSELERVELENLGKRNEQPSNYPYIKVESSNKQNISRLLPV
uniref:Uncharacterized protein n=1 Tax=Meloidogyne enterolobii TaxID=390850 RepID=A0A6V7XD16_MELEN|nr:unnamed protein product [Meloidogyne enterolobii]